MRELISVIVPVYNVEKYLDKCIQSIVSQTYSDLEIIVVDDGSTDSCPEKLDKLREEDSRIKIFRQKNAGLSAARNTGIENAKGSYLLFVDSDDYINPHMVEILYDNLITYKADVSICDLHWIDEFECAEEDLDNTVMVYEGRDVVKKLIRDDLISVVAWNKLYKAWIFDDIRYPVGRLNEDEYIIHKILAKCQKSVYTKAKLYYYIKRKGSISDNITVKNVMDEQDALCQRLIWSIEYGDRAFSNWCFDNMLAVGYHAIGLFSTNVSFHDKIQKSIREALEKARVGHAINFRRVIVGYTWLVSPKASSKVRWLLHCYSL